MIIYFTGTGNSRYIAETISKRLDDDITDATDLMKENCCPDFISNKPYVFVAPTYAWRLPRIFEKWICNCTFKGNKKVYFVLTCGGEIGAADNYAKRLAINNDFKYMGTAQVVMPENYIVMFEPTTKENDLTIFNAATEKAEKLCEKISTEKTFNKAKISIIGHLYSDFINPLFYTFYVGARKFYTTDACISCGKCAKECVMNNITLKDGKPIWGNDCTHCMACICKCPTEAIEYGQNTKGKRRYIFNIDK